MSFAIDQTTNKKRSRGLSQAMLKFGCIHMDLGNGTWIYILTYVCNAHSYDSFHIDLFLKMLITTWIFVLSSLFALIFRNKNKPSSKCFFSWFLTSVLYIYFHTFNLYSLYAIGHVNHVLKIASFLFLYFLDHKH